ncbi:MAG: acetoin utilization protein AcuC [Candidatus Thorarchaeota archaeon]|nr:MAG: acetoin utilization protein AcuC [Candidatus Thorarchaeota archaeon]
MSHLTAVFSSEKILKLDGIDELDTMRMEPNPFWNRPRLDITWGLPVMSGLLKSDRITIQQMRLATREELGLYHDPSYIETIELFGNMGSAFASRFGLDTDECPVFYQMDKYASYPVGATIDAVMGVADGKFEDAMSIIGGFHHAYSSSAGGFCYLNDTVVAIKKFKEKYPDQKVLYLDTDVHHGDATQQAFYDDPNVLTMSTHELSMGFFPGTGRPEEVGIGEGKGYSVNIPLPPLTDDFEYWKAFEELVVPIWLAYKPDLVLWNVGADGHMDDPLADLLLNLDTYHRLSKTVRQLAHLGNKKLVIVGGGGYNAVAAGKVWTVLLADLADIALPPLLPAEWIEMCHKYGLQVKRGGWTDRPTRMYAEHESKVKRAVDETIEKVKELIFPTFGLE